MGVGTARKTERFFELHEALKNRSKVVVLGMRKLLVILLTLAPVSPVMAAYDTWVTSDRLNRRTCPDIKCGIVGRLFFREKATVLEQKGGWARISKYYDASCRNGKSQYVDAGNAACRPDNGIVRGRFAEWVSLKFLARTRPADPGAKATGDYALVQGSDDYRIYKDAFAKAAAKLISSGRCTAKEFREMGGWAKSSNRRGPIYFMYCGGSRASNRLYLNAETGRIRK